MRKPDAGPPRVMVLKPEDIVPDLLTAFLRWREYGELPPAARLCEFVGGDLPLLDLETCKRCDGEGWGVVSDVMMPKVKGKPKRQYKIFVIRG